MPVLTQKTIDHIKLSEGLSLVAYPDPGSSNGKPVTIGYGTTKINGKDIKLGTKITKEQAEQYLIADLTAFATKVAALIKVKLTDYQFGALVSFAYNIGLDAFKNSTLLRLLNVGDFQSVPKEMRRWNKNDGKVMKGLVNRREAEVALWLGVSIVAPTEAVQGTKPSTGQVGSRNIFTLLLELLIKLFTGRK